MNEYGSSISADGRYVAFFSGSTRLVAGDTNGLPDVFVRDRQAGTTQRVSVAGCATETNGDSLSPSISPDGPIALVGPYQPTTYAFKGFVKGMKPSDFAGWDSPIPKR